MSEFSGEVWFLASCIELYKTEKKMSGQEAFNYLHRTGATNFIIDCWDGLHITGPLYIVDSIDEYIANHTEEKDIGSNVLIGFHKGTDTNG